MQRGKNSLKSAWKFFKNCIKIAERERERERERDSEERSREQHLQLVQAHSESPLAPCWTHFGVIKLVTFKLKFNFGHASSGNRCGSPGRRLRQPAPPLATQVFNEQRERERECSKLSSVFSVQIHLCQWTNSGSGSGSLMPASAAAANSLVNCLSVATSVGAAVAAVSCAIWVSSWGSIMANPKSI